MVAVAGVDVPAIELILFKDDTDCWSKFDDAVVGIGWLCCNPTEESEFCFWIAAVPFESGLISQVKNS